MATATLRGIITDIFPTEHKTANFSIRPFWIKEEAEKYPNTWEVQCFNSDCASLDHFMEGNLVQVEVEIRGKLWESGGKSSVFNTLKSNGIKLLQK